MLNIILKVCEALVDMVIRDNGAPVKQSYIVMRPSATGYEYWRVTVEPMADDKRSTVAEIGYEEVLQAAG